MVRSLERRRRDRPDRARARLPEGRSRPPVPVGGGQRQPRAELGDPRPGRRVRPLERADGISMACEGRPARRRPGLRRQAPRPRGRLCRPAPPPGAGRLARDPPPEGLEAEVVAAIRRRAGDRPGATGRHGYREEGRRQSGRLAAPSARAHDIPSRRAGRAVGALPTSCWRGSGDCPRRCPRCRKRARSSPGSCSRRRAS